MGQDLPSNFQAEMLKHLSELRAEIRALKAELGQTRADTADTHLSFREAAARLRIDRNTTLKDLVKKQQIRVINVNGKTRIPSSEVKRLNRDGFTVKPDDRATKKKKSAVTDERPPSEWKLRI